jgi:hypothetical protein
MMFRIVPFLFAVLVVVQAEPPRVGAQPPARPETAPPAPGHGPISSAQLGPETFERFRDLIRPNGNEYAWRKIRWTTDFWTARRKAAALDKPILVFWLHGAGYHDPLGLC